MHLLPPRSAVRCPPAACGTRAGQGFVLPAMLIAGLVVSLGGATIVSRALSQRLGQGMLERADEAREAAEFGFDFVKTELNREENRQLAGANVSMNNWGATTGVSLRNPCIQNADGSPANLPPTSTAISLSNGEWQTLPNNPNARYRIRSATVKEAHRDGWIRTELSSTGGSATVTTSETKPIRPTPYRPTRFREDYSQHQLVSRLELTIEGQSLVNGVVMSSRVMSQEFSVVPKCCRASIGDNIPLMTQACASGFPSLLIGLNGGGVLRSGSGAQLRERPVGSGVPSNTVQKPARLLCVNNSGTCGGQVTDSVDGVPIQTIQFAPQVVPTNPYPIFDRRTGGVTPMNPTGFTIEATSAQPLATQSLSTDTQSQAHQDYLRINSRDEVELCNVTMAAASGGNPARRLFVNANSCDKRINSYCVRSDDYVYHCRIARLVVLDDPNRPTEGPTGEPIENNTFFIDSSRGRIILHFNSRWVTPASCGGPNDSPSPICLLSPQNGQIDGQIQHVYCPTPDDAIPCDRRAELDPDNSPRAILYSDTNISFIIGAKGFIRDLFVFMAKGTLTLAEDPFNAINTYGAPNYRGPLWIDNLSMGRGINDGHQTQIEVPAFSSNFQGMGTFSTDNPLRILPIFEWIVRGTTWRSLAEFHRTPPQQP
jgi:hypothetical protein